MTPHQVKRTLRRAVIARILAIPPNERTRQQSALVEAFPALPGFAEAQTVLLYASVFPEEFETRPMLRLAIESGKRLVCPRVKPPTLKS